MKFLLIFSILGTIISSSSANEDVSGGGGGGFGGGGGNASSCVAPPPFDDASLLDASSAIRMVMSITTGDYFVHLVEGARMQARVVGGTGIDSAVTSSGGNGAGQARLVSDAASIGGGGIVGILTVGGHADEMCGAINEALSKNVTVVSFDTPTKCAAP